MDSLARQALGECQRLIQGRFPQVSSPLARPVAILTPFLCRAMRHCCSVKLKCKVQAGFSQLLSSVQGECAQDPPQQQQSTPQYVPPVILSTQCDHQQEIAQSQKLQQMQQQQQQAPQQEQQQLQQMPAPLHIIRITCQKVSPIPSPKFGNFIHPGTLMGPREVLLLQQRVAGTVPAPPPFTAAVASLRQDTPLDYSPHALEDVYVEWYDGPKIGHKELVEEDGRMVYMQVCYRSGSGAFGNVQAGEAAVAWSWRALTVVALRAPRAR